MNWYLQSSEDCDVVKSSRIRLARNLNGFKFNLENKSEIEQLENKIKDNLYSIGYGLKYLKLKDIKGTPEQQEGIEEEEQDQNEK